MPKPLKIIVNSSESLSTAIGKLRGAWARDKYLRVTIVSGKNRSIQQNRLLHDWINQIADERGEITPFDVKAEVKLRFFTPILRAEDEEFCAAYDAAIKPLDYQTKLQAIVLIPVTSRCSVSQLSRGLEAMQMHYAALDVDPVFLEWPDEMKK